MLEQIEQRRFETDSESTPSSQALARRRVRAVRPTSPQSDEHEGNRTVSERDGFPFPIVNLRRNFDMLPEVRHQETNSNSRLLRPSELQRNPSPLRRTLRMSPFSGTGLRSTLADRRRDPDMLIQPQRFSVEEESSSISSSSSPNSQSQANRLFDALQQRNRSSTRQVQAPVLSRIERPPNALSGFMDTLDEELMLW